MSFYHQKDKRLLHQYVSGFLKKSLMGILGILFFILSPPSKVLLSQINLIMKISKNKLRYKKYLVLF